MLKCLPYEFPVDRIECSLEINEIDVQWDVVFKTIVYYQPEGVKLVNT